jgi:serine/threonine protein kinase
LTHPEIPLDSLSAHVVEDSTQSEFASAQEALRGRYEFIEPLGQGGMGVLYKARHLLMDKYVVIKLLHSRLRADSRNIIRFQTEAKAANKLNHTHIVKVTDFGLTADQTAYLVMDYVEGKSLARLIAEEGPLTLARAAVLFIQIADALAHAHKHGILHRDLKPGNIMIHREPDGSESAMLTDFGIAKLHHDSEQSLTQTGEVFGSPLYMSPEQCMGMQIHARAEVYSMGCLMYETLTGTPPHTSPSALDLMHKHINAAPVPLNEIAPEVPAAFTAVVDKALAKSPDDRYQSMTELREAIHRATCRRKLTIPMIAGVSLWMALPKPTPTTKTVSPNIVSVLGARIEYKPNGMHVAFPKTATDRDLFQIKGNQNVWTLDLKDCRSISDQGLMQIANCRGLRVLSLENDSQLTDAIVPTLNNLDREELNLRVTSVNPGLVRFMHPEQVKLLWYGDTRIDDAGIAKMQTLPGLVYLGLCNTHITDAVIDTIVEKFPNVVALDFSKDYALSTTALAKLKALPKLKALRRRDLHQHDCCKFTRSCRR